MRCEFGTKSAAPKFLFYVLLALMSLTLLACGGGNSLRADGQTGEEVDIDKLLGSDEPQPATQSTSEEDEVLRLLGLVPAEKSEPPKNVEPEITEAPKSEPQPEVKPQEVERLQKELQQKEQFISELQSNIGEKEKKIQTLQSELEQAKRTAMASNTTNTKMISGDYAQRYARGRELYEQHKYSEAIAVFNGLLNEDAKNKLADNAQYWIGECQYGLRNWEQAMVEFEKVFLFSASEKHDDAQLKVALCYLRREDKAQAKIELERLIATYPTSEYIAKARQYLGGN